MFGRQSFTFSPFRFLNTASCSRYLSSATCPKKSLRSVSKCRTHPSYGDKLLINAVLLHLLTDEVSNATKDSDYSRDLTVPRNERRCSRSVNTSRLATSVRIYHCSSVFAFLSKQPISTLRTHSAFSFRQPYPSTMPVPQLCRSTQWGRHHTG